MKEKLHIKRFYSPQAEKVAEIIKRNLLDSSSKYCSSDYIASIVRDLSPEKLIENAKKY